MIRACNFEGTFKLDPSLAIAIAIQIKLNVVRTLVYLHDSPADKLVQWKIRRKRKHCRATQL